MTTRRLLPCTYGGAWLSPAQSCACGCQRTPSQLTGQWDGLFSLYMLLLMSIDRLGKAEKHRGVHRTLLAVWFGVKAHCWILIQISTHHEALWRSCSCLLVPLFPFYPQDNLFLTWPVTIRVTEPGTAETGRSMRDRWYQSVFNQALVLQLMEFLVCSDSLGYACF